MALKHLDNAEMLRLAERAAGDLAHALAASEHARTRAAFASLLPDLRAIQGQERSAGPHADSQAADARHDALARALLHHLSAFELTAPALEEAQALAAARRRVLAAGGRTVKRAFAKKAAEATLAPARVLPADLDRMRALPIGHHGTLLGLYEAWLAACADLGLAEQKRVSVRARVKRAISAFRVRNLFVDTVRRLRVLTDLPGEPNALAVEIARVEAEADARVRARAR